MNLLLLLVHDFFFFDYRLLINLSSTYGTFHTPHTYTTVLIKYIYTSFFLSFLFFSWFGD